MYILFIIQHSVIYIKFITFYILFRAIEINNLLLKIWFQKIIKSYITSVTVYLLLILKTN